MAIWERPISQTGDLSALDNIMARTGGVRVSAHVPAAASQKQNAVIRRGGRMDAVAPIWEGIELIVDPYTQTKAGEVVLTAVRCSTTSRFCGRWADSPRSKRNTPRGDS